MYKQAGIIASLSFILFFYMGVNPVAGMKVSSLQNDQVNILIVYSGDVNDEHPRLQELNLLFHHFTKNVDIKHVEVVEEEDLQWSTHLVYVGMKKEVLPKEQVQLLNKYPRMFLFIGENVEQFNTFPIDILDEEVKISALRSPERDQPTNIRHISSIKQLQTKAAHEILLYGQNDVNSYPVIVKLNSKRIVMLASMKENELNRVYRNYFIDLLHDIIPNNHSAKQIGIIRLEDIHPVSDPKPILEIGSFLNERQIPYQLVVTPVYVDSENGNTYKLEGNKELVDVLQTLQNDGYATIVSHGYKHEYYENQDGNGLEFWDGKFNQMIASKSYALASQIDNQTAFPNEEAYETYLRQLQTIEESYVDERLEESIYAFAKEGLYPAAFIPPGYAMSLNGYRILSHYFEGVVGRVQTRGDMNAITNAPVMTSASFLYGMTYYPETIGYYNPDDPSSLGEMKQKVKEISVIRDGVYSGFFHPYLGLEAFERFFSVFRHIEGIEWLDLKEEQLMVSSEHAKWYVDDAGDFVQDIDMTQMNERADAERKNRTELILWGITILVSLFVLIFLSIALYLRLTLRKKLFHERKQ